jgi:hypothetical protein
MKKLKEIVQEDDMGHLEGKVSKISSDMNAFRTNPQALLAINSYLVGVLQMKGRVDVKDFEEAIRHGTNYKR